MAYGISRRHDVRVCVGGTYVGGAQYSWRIDTFPLYEPGLLDCDHVICVQTSEGPKEIETCDHWPPVGMNGWGTWQVKVAEGEGGERWAVPYVHYAPSDCHRGVVLAGSWLPYYGIRSCRIYRRLGEFWQPRVVGPWRYPEDFGRLPQVEGLGHLPQVYVDEFMVDDAGNAHMTWRSTYDDCPWGWSASVHTAWDAQGNLHGPHATGSGPLAYGRFVHNRSGDCWLLVYNDDTGRQDAYHSSLSVDGPGEWARIGDVPPWGPVLVTERECLVAYTRYGWFVSGRHLYASGVRMWSPYVCRGDEWYADYLTHTGMPMRCLGDNVWWTRRDDPSYPYWNVIHFIRTEGTWGVPDENRELRRLSTHGGLQVYFATPFSGYMIGSTNGKYLSGDHGVRVPENGIYAFEYAGKDDKDRDLWTHSGPIWTQPHPHECWGVSLAPRGYGAVRSSFITEEDVIVCEVERASRTLSYYYSVQPDALGLVHLPSGEMELVAGLDGDD